MNGLNIGIDDNTSLFYEGSLSLYGHAIWPSPFMSVVSHIGELGGWRRDRAVVYLAEAPMLFREDSFDPVARVRRGRLYVRRQQENPAHWRVQRHPAYATSGVTTAVNRDGYGGPDERGFFAMRLTTFESWRASEDFLKKRQSAVLVMGTGDPGLVHQVLDVERLATGEELITVRTRPSMSGLLELIAALISVAAPGARNHYNSRPRQAGGCTRRFHGYA